LLRLGEKKDYGQKNITSSSVVVVVDALVVVLMSLGIDVFDCFESGLRMRNFSGNFG